MQSLNKRHGFKVHHILYAFVIIVGTIVARLIYLQIHKSYHFSVCSTKNFSRTEKIPSLRGNILDKNGILLATNKPIINICWKGSGNKKLTADQEKDFKMLSDLLGIEYEKELSQLMLYERSYKKKLIAYDVSFETQSKIEELFKNHTNIMTQVRSKRYYPYKSYASHLIGYLGNLAINPIGLTGLEKTYHETLKGHDGMLRKIINSLGKNMIQEEIDKSFSGDNIQTTLDITLQSIAESVFPENHGGAMIVMNSNNGAIRALLSRPAFDPTLFLESMLPSEWRKLQENNTLLNKAFYACYPLGSIFKLVTISAAIEQKIIDPEQTWYCSGNYTFCNRKYRCHRRWGHGHLSTVDAVAQSCNILFFDIGAKIDIDTLATYAQYFGLGQKTGIPLTEKTGLVPSRAWKLKTKKERWWQGETLSVAIGQSFLLATPIQIARMISAIFTGYLVQPRIIESDPIIYDIFPIEKSTRNFLQLSMESVVKIGTGRRLNAVKNIDLHAKTSTAQICSLDTQNKSDITQKEHAWFVAHVAYKDHEPLTLVIMIEHAGSSRVPTSVAQKFLMQYKKTIDSTFE